MKEGRVRPVIAEERGREEEEEGGGGLLTPPRGRFSETGSCQLNRRLSSDAAACGRWRARHRRRGNRPSGTNIRSAAYSSNLLGGLIVVDPRRVVAGHHGDR